MFENWYPQFLCHMIEKINWLSVMYSIYKSIAKWTEALSQDSPSPSCFELLHLVKKATLSLPIGLFSYLAHFLLLKIGVIKWDIFQHLAKFQNMSWNHPSKLYVSSMNSVKKEYQKDPFKKEVAILCYMTHVLHALQRTYLADNLFQCILYIEKQACISFKFIHLLNELSPWTWILNILCQISEGKYE